MPKRELTQAKRVLLPYDHNELVRKRRRRCMRTPSIHPQGENTATCHTSGRRNSHL
jgi:hypothetical protein